MSEIAKLFAKHPEELSREDIDQIVLAYQEHMNLLRVHGPKIFNPKTGEKKKIRRKAKATVDPRQADLEELIAKETAK